MQTLPTEPTLIKGGIAVDDRGSLSFVNDFGFSGVKRFYQVSNHQQGFIRAWHGHFNEAKYVYVAYGSAIVAATAMIQNVCYEANAPTTKFGEIKRFVLSSKNPSILYIPPKYFNGFKTLEPNTQVFFFSTSTLEESKNDDIRVSADVRRDVFNIEER